MSSSRANPESYASRRGHAVGAGGRGEEFRVRDDPVGGRGPEDGLVRGLDDGGFRGFADARDHAARGHPLGSPRGPARGPGRGERGEGRGARGEETDWRAYLTRPSAKVPPKPMLTAWRIPPLEPKESVRRRSLMARLKARLSMSPWRRAKLEVGGPKMMGLLLRMSPRRQVTLVELSPQGLPTVRDRQSARSLPAIQMTRRVAIALNSREWRVRA
jgi:hypothetical protein